MVDSVEFLPIEVIKDFMSLTVGDILRMSVDSGNYELHVENEDVDENKYSYDKYEISLEPWIIQKYNDHFQIYNPKEIVKLSEKSEDKLTETIEVSHPTLVDDNIETTVTTASTKDDSYIDKVKVVGMNGLSREIEYLIKQVEELNRRINDMCIKPKSKVKK